MIAFAEQLLGAYLPPFGNNMVGVGGAWLNMFAGLRKRGYSELSKFFNKAVRLLLTYKALR